MLMLVEPYCKVILTSQKQSYLLNINIFIQYIEYTELYKNKQNK